MARIISITLGLVLALVVLAVLLLPLLVDKEEIIALAAEGIKEETGATLTVGGDLDLSVFPTLRVAVGDAAITLPDKAEPDLEIASASIGVQLLPLFSGQVEIKGIEVDGLIVRTQTSTEDQAADTSEFSDAQLDAYYEERTKKREAASQASGAETALAVPLALNVASLVVNNARIESFDTTSSTTSVIELTSLEASGLNLDGSDIPLKLALRIPGDTAMDVALEGRIAVSQETESVDFSDLDIVVTGATPKPLKAVVDGSLDLSRQVADTDIRLRMGKVQGSGKLRYASFESPQIDARLKLNLFDPLLFALAGPEAASSAGDAETATGDEPLPLDALRAIDTRARLNIEKAQFGAHTVENLAVRLRVVDGVANLRDISGKLHGGTIEASARLDGSHTAAKLTTSGKVESMDLDRAMTAAASPGLVSGAATLDWQLSSKGKTVNELTAALAGPIELNTADVLLKGTSIEKMLCRTVALTNQEALTATFSPDTAFTRLSASVQVENGKAKLKPLRAELAHATLKGSGNYDLLSQDFRARFKGRLSPGLEELDRACRVSKRLTNIDFPVECKGNIASDPGELCSVDSQEIMKDVAVQEGKRQLEKKTGDILGKFLGGKKDKGEEKAN